MKMPDGWRNGHVRDLIASMDAGVSVNSTDEPASDNEVGILKTSCVTKGKFETCENKRIVNDEVDRARINPQAGCIIMSRMNTPALVGASAYVAQSHKNLYLPDRLWQMVPQKDLADMRWLSFVLDSPLMRSKISAIATGTSDTMKNISKEDVTSLRLVIPQLLEQRAISDLLSTWDTAIDKTERLIATKEKQYKYLMNTLIVENENWRLVTLGDVFKERNEPNRVDLPLLSIMREEGVVLQADTDRKDNSNEDKSKYLRICPGDIGYNTMRMWQGVSALSSIEGIVSPAYTICTPTDDVDVLFASFWFKNPYMVHRFYKHSQGMTSDTWCLKFHHFSKIKAFLPPMALQKEVAGTLLAAQKEIFSINAILEKLKLQKRGLMQKLLTGEWRTMKMKLDATECTK
jgi:type I restriction enzyme S subunit